MSRHRGAKPCRRCELLGRISLLSPGYLLSDERRHFTLATAGSLSPTFVPARLVCLAVKLPYAFALYGWFPISLREPSHASVTVLEATAPVKLPTRQCPSPGSRVQVRFPESTGWYFTVGSPEPKSPGSKPPTYPTQLSPKISAKLQ